MPFQLKNNRLIKAIYKEPLDATPIWIMRQAGRYLPEYRKTRERAGSFLNLCKTPELACEVTLQPLNRYDLDAAIIFSDILTIPDAMGLGLYFVEGEGPKFAYPLTHERDMRRINVPDLDKLQYVYDTIGLVAKELSGNLPLIGFCGSPWTLAAYMIEGQSKPGFPAIINMMHKEPFLLHHLLDILAQAVSLHLNAQIEAGCQVVMIFDTWGGILSRSNYEEFSLYYLKQITARLLRKYNNNRIPLILFTKNGNHFLEQLVTTGCDALGIDGEISMREARTRVGEHIALQGNLNPMHLLESPEKIEQEALQVLDSFGRGSGHVFNLGHGITPDVRPENVEVLVSAVHELSKEYHIECNAIAEKGT